MEKFKSVMKLFAKDDSGAALVEYAVIVGIVIIVGGAVLVSIGGEIGRIFAALLARLQLVVTT